MHHLSAARRYTCMTQTVTMPPKASSQPEKALPGNRSHAEPHAVCRSWAGCWVDLWGQRLRLPQNKFVTGGGCQCSPGLFMESMASWACRYAR